MLRSTVIGAVALCALVTAAVAAPSVTADYERAATAARLGDHETAIREFRTLLARKDADGADRQRAATALGLVYLRSGRRQAAQRCLSWLVSVAPSSPGTEKLRAAFEGEGLRPLPEAVAEAMETVNTAVDLGAWDDQDRAPDLRRAEQIFRRALDERVAEASAHYGLGACLALLGAPRDQALTHLTKSVAMGHVHPNAFALLARLYRAEGDFPHELACLDSAARCGALSGELEAALARAYARRNLRGDAARAEQYARAAIERGASYGEGLAEVIEDPETRARVRSLQASAVATEEAESLAREKAYQERLESQWKEAEEERARAAAFEKERREQEAAEKERQRQEAIDRYRNAQEALAEQRRRAEAAQAGQVGGPRAG